MKELMKMKFSKTLITSVVAGCVLTTSAFAATVNGKSFDSESKKEEKSFYTKMFKQEGRGEGAFEKKDPITVLETRKTQITNRLDEKKITEEQAKERIAQIDAKIKEINDFNALPLEQKKETLKKEYAAKVDAWDGTGKPMFEKIKKQLKGHMASARRMQLEKKDPLTMLEARKTQITKRLNEKKITEEQAKEQLAQVDAKMKEINDFNALSLEQKKEKVVNDFKTNIQKAVDDKKISQEKADEMIKNHLAQVEEWDGTGKPLMGKKHVFDNDKHKEKVGKERGGHGRLHR
jgi:hypothetical protein